MAYDIVIVGGGIAGLHAAAALTARGYNLILVEKDALGCGQTLASQGMIHGGQKYALHGVTAHAQSVAAMPERWEKELAGVKILSETQTMFSAGGMLSDLALFAASKAVRGDTEKKGDVYILHEKVLDVKSLVAKLSQNIRAFKGTPEGLQAKLFIYTAGLGNEGPAPTQRRPLRQIMVRTMKEPLYGHGVTSQPKPRVTVTAHPIDGGYVWYLGGTLAEKSVTMTEDDAIAFAQREMREIFPQIDWRDKEWASLSIDRAEPLDAKGLMPEGPHIARDGNVARCWPIKLTLTPALTDKIIEMVDFAPGPKTADPDLPRAEIGSYPWEVATWKKI